MSEQPAEVEDLDSLPYAELHDRALRLAQKRHDLSFFLDLYNHTRSMHAASTEGGSLGDLSGSLIDVVNATREAFADIPDPDFEPLFRARFVEYLRDNS